MIVSVHQPNYLPYPGLIGKIIFSDKFVYLGNVQFEKASWQNRNRLRNERGEVLLTVPVLTKGKFSQRISEVCINCEEAWHEKHLKTIYRNYVRTSYFTDFFPFFEEFYSKTFVSLYELDIFVMNYLLMLFDIQTEILHDKDFDFKGAKTLRLIDICKELNCNVFLSNKGSEAYVDLGIFEDKGLCHLYLDYVGKPYPQKNYPDFIPFLSIFDMLFNIGKDRTYQMISDRENYRFSEINKKLGGGDREKHINPCRRKIPRLGSREMICTSFNSYSA